jgi:hypothetical protein
MQWFRKGKVVFMGPGRARFTFKAIPDKGTEIIFAGDCTANR